MEKEDIRYMKEALKLAEKGKGYTHPNPAVGAVIVKDGKIIGKGYHRKAGLPHAEREAIKDAVSKGFDITGSTMYVTLEPCCHYGKTPPCTQAIIDRRIKRVVVAALDPNPLVSGKGVQTLRKAGIEVDVGILKEKAEKINEDFFVYIKEKRPFVHLKIAQTLDGKIATKTGSSKWITGEKARRYAHKLRKEATAVMVGVGTALSDNPSLTVRDYPSKKQPVRVLIDKDLKTPENYKIFDSSSKTIVFASKSAPSEKVKKLKEKGVNIIFLPLKDNRFAVEDILSSLYDLNVMHLLVEGGKDLITQFIERGLFDKISLFQAPKLIGEDGLSSVGSLGVEDVSQSVNFRIESIKGLDQDIYFELYPD
ncbi:bifunctional diaminohydroxyphosphoribosylaminopyrimidine deaminase/5-amino-6-(5-phosphoribosylamino)uracil reductase RibD [Persephonella sp.]|uniref:bifunctional diaminohydroxyphosphoribosylaminopyrimidine deaminase/5-amino-6-(5-phosphoribosylamino)uracil reductase RibD n=2 Tax=Persephonella sp. TaxID=2060922 RepID=UPI0025F9D001|nr:bifunctional diaminohydroxyphosphoribosylaminopyrimidine deaminase/5-amino-6-(5-phosphoribosylamino)uracil reductase RibD [Persephonella sp.]